MNCPFREHCPHCVGFVSIAVCDTPAYIDCPTHTFAMHMYFDGWESAHREMEASKNE